MRRLGFLLALLGGCGGMVRPSTDVGDGSPAEDATRPDVQSGDGGGVTDSSLTSDANAWTDDGASEATIGDGAGEADAVLDASDGGVCDPGAASWSPASLPGLVLWLEASAVSPPSGSQISLWPDLSPAGNDAVQTVPAYQPTFEAAAVGGLPAMRFDGNLTFFTIADSASLQWGTGDYTLMVIGQFASSGVPDQFFYQKVTASAPWYGPSLFVNSDKPSLDTRATSQLAQYTLITSAHDGLGDAPHLFGGRRFGSSLEVRVDGASDGVTTVPSLDISAAGSYATMGQNGYSPQPGFQALDGTIAEVVAVGGPIASADLQTLECHLLLKYGVAHK